MIHLYFLVICILAFGLAAPNRVLAQQAGTFNGLGTELGNLYRLPDAQSRSISPENFTGGKGRLSGGCYNGRYLPLQDDMASVAYWYQTKPHPPFPKLPSKDDLEVK